MQTFCKLRIFCCAGLAFVVIIWYNYYLDQIKRECQSPQSKNNS